MTEEIRALAIVTSGLVRKQPIDQLLKDARIWGARQAPFRRALQRLRAPVVSEALSDAARIDRMIKGIGAGDVWNEFLRLGLKLCASS